MASGSFYKAFTSHSTPYKLIVDWSSTPNTGANSSVVVAKISLYCPYRLNISARSNNAVVINGVTYYYNSSAINGSGTYTLGTVTSGAIAHNADGSKSVSISCNFAVNATINGTYYGTITASATVTLDKIARKATITAAPNFNDEENPTITYSNGAGNAVDSLEACISLDGSKDDVAYRAISKTGTTYTFNLTDAERKVLRAATTGTSRTVSFFVRTVLGGVTYHSVVTKTFSVVNGAPTIAPTVVDTGSISTILTGDSGIIIKGFNAVRATINAAALKEASISAVSIANGGKTVASSSAIFDHVESAEFTFTATDSRGLVTKKTVTKTLIPYFKPTINLAKHNVSTAGEYVIDLSGRFYNGSFGAVNNNISVQFKWRLSGGEWSEWQSLSANISGNDYTAEATVTGLDYKSGYDLQCRVIDAIGSRDASYIVYTNEITVVSIPVFDYGKGDFNFNVPVTIQGRKVYAPYMLYDGNTNGVVTLSDSINNYDFVEILFTDNNGRESGSCKLYDVGASKTVDLALIEASAATATYIRRTAYICKGTTLTPNKTTAGYLSLTTGAAVSHNSGTNYIYVEKVIGYK